MPSKTDFSIRRLISAKRREGDNVDLLPFESSSPPPKSHSWIPAQPKQRQPPIEPLVIHDFELPRTMATPVPMPMPLPTPPYSNAGSPPRDRSMRDRFERISRSSSTRTLTPSPTPDYNGRQRALTTYTENRLRPVSPFRRATSPAHSFDLGDDQGYMAEQREIPRKPVGSSRSSRTSSNASASSLQSNESSMSRRPSTPAARIPTPVPEEIPRSSSSLSILKKEDSPKKRATMTTPLVKSGSVSKNKGRRNSRQSKQPSPKKPTRNNSRWTFTDNVTELFTGQLFKRIEADEMLTPEQVEAYTRRREAKAEMVEKQEMEALEVIRSILEEEEEPDSPMEPFHLEELAKRISDVAAAASQHRESPLKQELANDVVRRDFSVRRKPVRSAMEHVVSPITLEETPVPSPPAKNPARYMNNHAQAAKSQMPSIPELLVTTPENEKEKEAAKDPVHGNTPTKETLDNPFEDDDFVFFKSTPCTMTMPGFRHGPIRIAKSGLDVMFDPENTLDWTAFQMAILGGAGDFFYGSADLTPQYSEEEEVAELKEWLGELGFSSIGALISSQPVERPEDSDESSSNSPISASSSCYDEEEDDEDCENLPIPVALDYPTGFWNDGKLDTSKFSVGGGCQIKRWTVEGHPKRYNRASCSSDISLPQSPMMPLIVESKLTEMRNAAAQKVDKDVVPMGYNLGHDLGDFLRWEAEHCYATDF